MFSCVRLNSGAAFLNADLAITCWDTLHWRYVGAAVVWLFIVPVGIPALFLQLLRRFKIPQLALLRIDNGWLREASKKLWECGVDQPASLNVGLLTVESISDVHLEVMSAVLLNDASVETAADILSGKLSGIAFEESLVAAAEKEAPDAPQAAPPGLKERLLARGAEAVAALRARLRGEATEELGDGAAAGEQTPQARRDVLLARVLLWCRTSGEVALPVMNWEDKVEEEQVDQLAAGGVDGDAAKLTAGAGDDAGPTTQSVDDVNSTALEQHFGFMHSCTKRDKAAAAPGRVDKYGGVTSKEVNALTERAMKEVGFLFAAYHCSCWCACPRSVGSDVASPSAQVTCAARRGALPLCRAYALLTRPSRCLRFPPHPGTGRPWSWPASSSSPPSWRSCSRAAPRRLWLASSSHSSCCCSTCASSPSSATRSTS
jgi:hypothetical protein